MGDKEICRGELCIGCGVCASVCPKECIELQKDWNGFYYPHINSTNCVQCQLCIKKCPQNTDFQRDKTDFYMAWHQDKDVLLKSSSGGAFTSIARYVLQAGGVVVGAMLQPASKEVSHVLVEHEEELDKLRMSKYYQSKIENAVYQEIKTSLARQRWVLFSGTACQIAAVYKYVGEKDKLLTVDVLCHGVTSKKVVDAYIQSKEKQHRKRVLEYKFRVKGIDGKWVDGGGTRIKLQFEDGSTFVEPQETDTFFMGFNQNIFLREACYNCKYCGTERIADFTLADFWGVSSQRVTEEQKALGVSLVLLNSEKARNMFPELEKELVITKIEPEEAVPYNLALVKPNERPIVRDTFFEKLDYMEFDTLVKSIFRKKYFKIEVKKQLCKILGEKNFNKLKKIIKG